jgi:hypothetical protein
MPLLSFLYIPTKLTWYQKAVADNPEGSIDAKNKKTLKKAGQMVLVWNCNLRVFTTVASMRTTA